jgi:hypothetical protein
VVGDWRRLRNEELHNMYASPNSVRVMKLRRIRWPARVVLLRKLRNACNIFVGKLERERSLKT